jgi:NAD(P)H dehydrogenase (quinone)
MNIIIIFDHPYGASASKNELHRRSYSAALLDAVKTGLKQHNHTIDLIDLHTDGFYPVMTESDLKEWRQKKTTDPIVLDYQRRLMAADHIIFIFPIWWECMPAMTKGFLDRVFVKGIVFDEQKKGRPFVSLLPKLKGVSLLTVMSTPKYIYNLIFSNVITKILFRGTFRKMGIHKLKWFSYHGMENRSLIERQKHLHKTERYFREFTG